MKRSVTFAMEGFDTPITGYEGGQLPIDKAAEAVLSTAGVASIIFQFEAGTSNTFNVLHSNDDTIGAPCQVMHVPSWERDSWTYRGSRCMVSGMLIGTDHGHNKCPLHRNDVLAAATIRPQTGDMLHHA